MAATLLAVLASVVPPMPVVASTTRARFEASLHRAVAPVGGNAGVAVVHVQTGESASFVIGTSRFPMASVYKLPIAVAVLRRVDRGILRLGDAVTVTQRDLRPGENPGLTLARGRRSTRVTVRRLLELMITRSDNGASDVLLRLAGGPGAVTRILLDSGVSQIEVSRPEVQLMADWYGVRELPPPERWTPEVLERAYGSVPRAQRAAAAARFGKDGRDTATPEAMADLLVKLQRGRVLSPASTALLRGMLERCETGDARLPALLPKGTVVAHKTGTLGWVVNDAGLVTLPGGRGHVAVVVFLSGSSAPRTRCEQAIARVAKIAYDYYAGGAPVRR
jgi:beta-lactamase class A